MEEREKVMKGKDKEGDGKEESKKENVKRCGEPSDTRCLLQGSEGKEGERIRGGIL